MKYIRKGNPPGELEIWFKKQPIGEDGIRINCTYKDGMRTEVKEAIKKRLLRDQGWLCCYTGLRIEMESTHIEHLKPQQENFHTCASLLSMRLKNCFIKPGVAVNVERLCTDRG